MGARQLVRCSSGHVFRTIWIPGVSLKALRLGWWRVQYCPVGHHWTLVSPIKDDAVVDLDGDVDGVPNDIAIP
ncbi:MAG: hypothetical protein HIU57_05675 [Acidobacteria bacterium]|nr:hypothetical protein [Acidobacteriota bacterium]